MTENSQPIELTEQDEKDLATMGLGPQFELTSSLLVIWQEVLSNAGPAMSAPITLGETLSTLQRLPQLKVDEVPAYFQEYYRTLVAAHDIVFEVLDSHPKAKEHVGPEDVEHNAGHYKEVLVNWRLEIDACVEDWELAGPGAFLALPRAYAIADAREFLFGRMGLVNHLDSIGFEMSSDDFEKAVAAEKEKQ